MAFLAIRKKSDWEYFELTSKNQSHWVEIIGSIQDIKINNYEQAKRSFFETLSFLLLCFYLYKHCIFCWNL